MKKIKKDKKQDGDYGMVGISLGMGFGLLIGIALGDHTGIGMCLGALAGFAIGLCIHRKPDEEDQLSIKIRRI